MKHTTVTLKNFNVGDPITVIDTRHQYYNYRGIIERLSTAGEFVTYIHVQLQNVLTVIAMNHTQIQIDKSVKA